MITKYQIISKFGSGNTISSIELEPYLEIELMKLCMMYESKGIEMQREKNTFYAKELT